MSRGEYNKRASEQVAELLEASGQILPLSEVAEPGRAPFNGQYLRPGRPLATPPKRTLLHSTRRAAHGRLLEVTNGGFVDAKREKPRLSVGQLWGNPTGGFGSGAPVRGLRMQSFSRDPLPGDGGHPRTTAVSVADLLGGVIEGQVPG